MAVELHFLSGLDPVDAEAWDALASSDYPFVQHRFLSALEQTGCVGADSGWQPQHLWVTEQGRPLAAAPLYLKQHSWGEYVFDFAWAEAYQRAGRAYYPKLLCAIPFTPARGPRLLGNPTAEQMAAIQAGLEQQCRQLGASGLHWLLDDRATELAPRWPRRETVQFHWFNENYRDFDDFLAAFASRKRKMVVRERRRVAEQGIRISRHTGPALGPAQLADFYRCYRNTYLKRSGHGGYLNEAFFQRLGQCMADQLLLVEAHEQDRLIASALYFYDRQCLYGRYWGCLAERDCLHFELCFYQGIEFAIERGLARFDAGAQGEHKIVRGFRPVSLASNHWLAAADGQAAIRRFIEEERRYTQQYLQDASGLLPFRTD